MRRARTLGPFLLMTVAVSLAWAQAPVPSPSPTPGPAEMRVAPAHASARATMRTFLEAFADYAAGGPQRVEQLDRAVACLDLSELPVEVRLVRGRELAVMLKGVIDRTRFVVYDEISELPEGPPYVFARLPEGEIVIDRYPSGAWLFTADTVASIPELYAAVEELELVEGAVEVTRAVSPGMWLRARVPAMLRHQALFLEYWQWLGLFVLILVGAIADRTVVFFAQSVLGRFLRARRTSLDPARVRSGIRPLGLVAMAMLWAVGLLWLALPTTVLNTLLLAARFVATVGIVWALYRLVDILSGVLEARAMRTSSKFDDLLVPLIRKSLKVFVIAFGVLFIAENLGTDITGLLAGVGLGGLAVALAAKDTVGNLFGSLTVLLDRPFKLGDWVIIGEVEGTVEELGFRSTRIRTFANSLVTLPNSNLIAAAVDNLGARSFRRWKSTLSVTYDTPPESIDAFCEGIRELVRRHPYTRKDYFHVYLNDFGPASLDILLYVFFVTPDWATELRERHRLAVDIVRLAHELGVEFAFPTQTLYLRRESWEPPQAAAAAEYGAASPGLSERARQLARVIAEGTTAGEAPPPVAFD